MMLSELLSPRYYGVSIIAAERAIEWIYKLGPVCFRLFCCFELCMMLYQYAVKFVFEVKALYFKS